MDINKFQEFRNRIRENVSKVIVGKEDTIDKVIVCFICSGHVLIEDVPGLGKTRLAKSLSSTMNCSFKRIQFTPDLLPSDLTGIYYYDQRNQDFQFRKGPLLSNFVLADEINRATPRTQSALLECMEERQITVEGNTIKLDKPFFVIATQNPVEQFGTFPLPEAQLDRFFMRLSMGYPQVLEEKIMMNRFMKEDPMDSLKATITMEDIEFVQNNYTSVQVSEEIKDYIIAMVNATRIHKDIELGCSPRATLNMMKGAQALAAIRGRDYVIPEDIKELAIPILSHRLVLNNELSSSDRTKSIIEEIINNIKAPLEEL